MNIIQAPQVSEETMRLLQEKNKLEGELQALINMIHERQESLADMISRQKSLEDSFIGNAEWLQKIKEMQAAYKVEASTLQDIVNKKEIANSEIDQLDRIIKEKKLIISRLDITQDTIAKQIEDLKKQSSDIGNLISVSQSKLDQVYQELNSLKEEKDTVSNELSALRNAIEIEDREIGKKRLDLQVYEQRIMREYAILFPDVS